MPEEAPVVATEVPANGSSSEALLNGSGGGLSEAAGAQAVASDYWTPQMESTTQVDEYPPLSPIPDHDGTECLKWDESLWSHGEHFKVWP